MQKKYNIINRYPNCPNCGMPEGELHYLGCGMETCPVCDGQAITCYEHCVDANGELQESFVNGNRYPYIDLPMPCCRCLEPWPGTFHADDWDVVIPPNIRSKVLCQDCYELVKMAWIKTRV